jgi:hypothetical protein
MRFRRNQTKNGSIGVVRGRRGLAARAHYTLGF